MPRKKRGRKARDEVMLLHLLKTFNCGWHKTRKAYNRKREKDKLKKEGENYD